MNQPKTSGNGSCLLLPNSFLSTEANKTGSWRFLRPRYDEKTSPCSAACPAGEDIARIEMLAAQGLFKEAWEAILRENPFPAVCGRVCSHPCENACNRGELDSTVAVHILERFLADTALRYDLKPVRELFQDRLPGKDEKIAVIGSGPSGLTAAYFLCRLGYRCDVFEASSEPGGILRWGIPEYRLPLAALRSEIARIEAEGVRIFTNRPVSKNFLAEARGDYDAVFLGCGHGLGSPLRIQGETVAGVKDGLEFLAGIRRGEPQKCDGLCAVIGGGNSAIDVARSIIRLGGNALILYRRRRQDMPASREEVEAALEEGVQLQELLAPARIAKDGKGLLLTMRKMKITGEDDGGRARVEPDGRKTMEFRVRGVFKAAGADAAEDWLNPPEKGRRAVSIGNCLIVTAPKRPIAVFGGDLVNPVKTVAHAVASGKAAAMALDTFFLQGIKAVRPGLKECAVANGEYLSMEAYLGGPRRQRNPHVVRYSEINTDYFRFAPRVNQPRLLKEERLRSFGEIDLKISANLAIREAERCMNCGLCNRCDNCYYFCPDLAVVRESEKTERRINYDYCKGCGLCVAECPRNAMTLEEEGR